MQRREFSFKHDPYGSPIKADVYFAKANRVSEEDRKHLAIVLHGGGFVVGSKEMIPTYQIEELGVNLGFVVVCANYRLCPTISVYDGPLADSKDCYLWATTQLPSILASEEGIGVDPTKTVTMGHSAGATLALLLGAMSSPPRAILDFYGAKYFADQFWHSPLPALSKIPKFDHEFISQIHNEIPPSSTSSLFQSRAPRSDLPSFDFSKARNAWLFTALKEGYHLSAIVKDGNYDRVDPTTLLSETFPPTCFIHGTADSMVDVAFSRKAYEELKAKGVECELHLAEGKNHGFDGTLNEDESVYSQVMAGLAFLSKHIE